MHTVFQTKVEFGTHVKELMAKVNTLEKKKFIGISVSFLVKCSIDLLNSLLLENQTIADSKYFLPALQQKPAVSNAIPRLTLSIAGVFGVNEMRKYFKLKYHASKFDLCDFSKRELAEYQTERILESFLVADKETNSEPQQYLCWKYVYSFLNIECSA